VQTTVGIVRLWILNSIACNDWDSNLNVLIEGITSWQDAMTAHHLCHAYK